jgi:hypothetical protein
MEMAPFFKRQSILRKGFQIKAHRSKVMPDREPYIPHANRGSAIEVTKEFPQEPLDE